MKRVSGAVAFSCAFAIATPALAGPPFLSDDPIPTPYQHYEVYAFANGETAHGDGAGAYGIDFNYGATPDLQLTAALPVSYEDPRPGSFDSGVGNVELAAKWRFLHQETFGWDVAIFPRVFLPSGSDLGDQHASLLLPIWLGRSGDGWSTFGGGGCAINRGGDSQDYCIAGWAFSYDVRENFHLGVEAFHQTADVRDGDAATTLGVGATYDLNDTLHLLGYAEADAEGQDRRVWYTSVLFTF